MIVVRDTGSMLVHAQDRGIDHLHRRIMTGGQRIYDLVPDASSWVQVGEANADRHGSAGPGLSAEPRGDSVSKMKQGWSKNSLFGSVLADRRLCSCRSARR
jgi:hypothetical protein